MHSKFPAMILAAALGTSLAFASFGADAMPAGTVDGASAAPHITLAAEGCGPGFARGGQGICRRIARERVVVVPARPVVVVPARPAVVVRRPVGCGVRVGPVAVRTGC